MPRKTSFASTGCCATAAGFNEAAARCRGKRVPRARLPLSAGLASMRPRPDAAENFRQPAAPPRSRCASMRPRPDAAENPEASLLPALPPALQ